MRHRFTYLNINSAAIFSQALLLDDETIAHAAALAAQMAAEDGVEGACQAFYKHLPVENMICDVSLFRGEYRLAQVHDLRNCLLILFLFFTNVYSWCSQRVPVNTVPLMFYQ